MKKFHVLTIVISMFVASAAHAAEWWQVLNDSTLNSLEARALEVNYDVDVAMHRVAVARQELASARAGYFPTVGLSAGWEKQRNVPSQWNLGANMSWEIDLFGRVTANANKSKAQVRASRADLEATRLTVTASVAQAYVQLRAAQVQLAVARAQAADQDKVAKIVEVRYNTGLASKLDVAQSLTTYYSTCASMPPLETEISQSIAALGVLLNVNPRQLQYLTDSAPLPNRGEILLPTEVPADDIRRRPDVMAAEAQIDVAAAALGIAKKEYLPALNLTGSISTADHKIGDLLTDHSFGYSIAPTLTWTVFDGLARRAGVATAKEEMQIAIDQYNAALLTGYQEVDDAIISYHNSLKTIDWIIKTVEQSQIALEKSLSLYKTDLASFTTVMQSQMSVLTYRTQLIRQRAEVLYAFINFHKALGY